MTPLRREISNIWYNIWEIEALIPKEPNNPAIRVGDDLGLYEITNIIWNHVDNDNTWLILAAQKNTGDDMHLHMTVNDHAIERVEYKSEKDRR